MDRSVWWVIGKRSEIISEYRNREKLAPIESNQIRQLTVNFLATEGVGKVQ